MNFEDVAIAFSREELEILDEAQRLTHCDTMLEVFALVSSVGCWHKMNDEEACSEQSVSVEKESPPSVSRTAPAKQKTHLCERCFSVLINILHMTEIRAAYLELKGFRSDARVRAFCVSANPPQRQRDSRGEKPWKEDMCRASFGSNCSFYLPWVPSISREFGEDFKAISDLLPHQVSLNTEPHSGSEMAQKFLSKTSLLQWSQCEKSASHNQKVVQHQGVCSEEVNYACNKCGKVFRHIFNLSLHMRVHTAEKPYVCTDCGKSFRHKSSLFGHHRVHTGEKPYQCSYCGKYFRRSSNLMDHCRYHTGEKPYHCNYCGKSFSRSSDLIQHHRIHTGEKPYQCSDCKKSFNKSSALIDHRRCHTGEKPYQCSDCGKSFSHSSTLTQHYRIHTGEKPYQCVDCGKSFSYRPNLVRHLRVHTGERPHECSRCGKSFARKSYLLRHLRVHTGEKP